ncbi:competence type IV pilus minor pilin ComGF [Planococcus sp. APC 3906]|uniref:competence type IV pilus minor pilin ComGF n=1 Tax=Planococcus sp. APC 3906 TaxID=3035194 RepID=UPI0025B5BCE5|nr:competence type IV pilus minor pilin ComGF [Planococcus sp. APC 3906]MDN3449893.1 competence type IV pilus minor pilin ComGF [Planococcus sp. APC 3906]
MNRVADEKGFTFLTSLFELLLLMIFLPLIVLFFVFMRGFFEEADPRAAEWFLFAGELQSYLSGAESLVIINTGAGVRIVRGIDEYDIESYDKVIRKQYFQKGHEVMLTGVKKTSFSLRGHSLLLQVEFTDGIILEEEYVFTQP